MGVGDFFRSVGRGINEGLKRTKLISTLAPVVGAAFGPKGAVAGQLVGQAAGSAGYKKGGKIKKPKKQMAKGGRVAAPKPKKAMRKGGRVSK